MTDKETFFLNDTPILVFEARRPDVTRFDDPDGKPAQPTDVEVRFFNGTAGEMVEIDNELYVPLGDSDSLLYMTAMDADEDLGALIYVTVPTEVTQEEGKYTLYVKTFYGDGLSISENFTINVLEYR
jgi:hypothetical protein